jgi:membrane protease YdiL (CAAX protease family)
MSRTNVKSEQSEALPQLSLAKIIIMFLWPAGWYTLLVHVIARPFVPKGSVVPTWLFLLVIVLGTGAEMLVAIIMLRRERKSLGSILFRDQVRLSWPRTAKAWAGAVVVFVVAMGLSFLAGPVNKALAQVPGFTPPAWWPILSNPTVPVESAADVFPDVALPGNYGFLIVFFLVGLVFNVFGEELYYRGYLLPRMRRVFGKGDWVANGLLFTLKHVYQRWLYPGIAVAGLSFAFMAGPVGSLPLAMVSHWLGNFLMPMILLLKEVLS